MKIEKTTINDVKTLIIKNDRYTTLIFKLYFVIDLNRRDHLLAVLLKDYMLSTSSKYKTEKEILKLKQRLYSFSYYISRILYSDKTIFSIEFSFVDPLLVEDDYFEEMVDVIKEFLFHPNFKNNKLDKEIFNRCKLNIINNRRSIEGDPSFLIHQDFNRIAFHDTYLDDIRYSLDEYIELVNSFTDEDVIDLYNRIINKSVCRMYLFGNYSDKYINLIKKNIVFKEVNNSKIVYKMAKINSSVKEVTKEYNSVESCVYALYSFPKLTKREDICLITLVRLLNYSGRLLHKVLRDKYSVIYSANASADRDNRELLIVGDISKNNKDKFIEGLDYLFNEYLYDDNVLEEALAINMKHLYVNYLTLDEDKNNVFSDIVSNDFYKEYTIKELYELSLNITKEDVWALVKKLDRKLIFFAKGVES